MDQWLCRSKGWSVHRPAASFWPWHGRWRRRWPPSWGRPRRRTFSHWQAGWRVTLRFHGMAASATTARLPHLARLSMPAALARDGRRRWPRGQPPAVVRSNRPGPRRHGCVHGMSQARPRQPPPLTLRLSSLVIRDGGGNGCLLGDRLRGGLRMHRGPSNGSYRLCSRMSQTGDHGRDLAPEQSG